MSRLCQLASAGLALLFAATLYATSNFYSKCGQQSISSMALQRLRPFS